MGEGEGVRKRRVFRWSKQARDLVSEDQQGPSKYHERNEGDRRLLVTKLAEVSGHPRDACLRCLRQLGVDGKRSYHEWTKPEQQRLLDLITTMPAVEAAKILRRPTGFAPCCTASAWAEPPAASGSPITLFPARYILALRKSRSGLIGAG